MRWQWAESANRARGQCEPPLRTREVRAGRPRLRRVAPGSSTRVESFRLPDLLAAAAAGYGQAA